ncbi:hypothetical protein HIM_05112 [Hirsutella minnesotensis 3608]|uniref:Uncharacterized protein n=1 Tax=Hirsutella minnesotensis 3608 TaxID=1043627 RepID=A0A0F7ZKM8_9HYPO|nr:hypothetical protein HIM_05112 [Hirsutella minnesotensis 3608]
MKGPLQIAVLALCLGLGPQAGNASPLPAIPIRGAVGRPGAIGGIGRPGAALGGSRHPAGMPGRGSSPPPPLPPKTRPGQAAGAVGGNPNASPARPQGNPLAHADAPPPLPPRGGGKPQVVSPIAAAGQRAPPPAAGAPGARAKDDVPDSPNEPTHIEWPPPGGLGDGRQPRQGNQGGRGDEFVRIDGSTRAQQNRPAGERTFDITEGVPASNDRQRSPLRGNGPPPPAANGQNAGAVAGPSRNTGAIPKAGGRSPLDAARGAKPPKAGAAASASDAQKVSIFGKLNKLFRNRFGKVPKDDPEIQALTARAKEMGVDPKMWIKYVQGLQAAGIDDASGKSVNSQGFNLGPTDPLAEEGGRRIVD